MKLGITGHQRLEDPLWVKGEVTRIIGSQAQPIIGVTCLAAGADQLFAQTILDCEGTFHVVIPCEKYEDVFDRGSLEEYQRLLSKAASSEIFVVIPCSEEAYFAAGKRVVDISDLMIAIWDGQEAAGLGGTADIVKYARGQGKLYAHVNPVATYTTFSHRRPTLIRLGYAHTDRLALSALWAVKDF